MKFKRRLRLLAIELRLARMHILVWSIIGAIGLGTTGLLVFRAMVFVKIMGALFGVAVPLLVGRWLYDQHQDRKRAKRAEPPRAWWVN